MKKSKNPKHDKKSGRKIFVKASAAKPLGRPIARDKTLGIEIEIRFY